MPPPVKPKDIVWRSAVNTISLGVATCAAVLTSPPPDNPANALGLRDWASWRIEPGPRLEAPTDVLGLHDWASWRIESGPRFEAPTDALRLRDWVSWRLGAPTIAPKIPPDVTVWALMHEKIFFNRTSAREGDTSLTSAVLQVMAATDPDPPPTITEAVERLRVILDGSRAWKSLQKVFVALER